MTTTVLRSFLPLVVPLCLNAAPDPPIRRAALGAVEKVCNERLSRIWPDNPMALIGSSRALYIPGFGVVISAEINLATLPGGLMNPMPSDADKAAVGRVRLLRLPELEQQLIGLLLDAGNLLEEISVDEHVAIAVILPRYSWEASSRLPFQMIIQATKGGLLAARRGQKRPDAVVTINRVF